MCLFTRQELLCLRHPEERHLRDAGWSGHIRQARVHYQVHMGTEVFCAYVSHALTIWNVIKCRGILVLEQNTVSNGIAGERWSQTC